MIQGVHAETVAFVNFQQAASLFRMAGWPWLGLQGHLATRRVVLRGTPPKDCRLRVTAIKLTDDHATCSAQLESWDAPPATALVRAEISLAPAFRGNGTARSVLTLRGTAIRDLAGPAGITSTEATRQLANQYARSLLEQIAAALERQTAKLAAS